VLRFRDAALRRRSAAIRRQALRARAVERVVSPIKVRAVGGAARAGVLVAEGDPRPSFP